MAIEPYEVEIIRVYKKRWLMLLIFVLYAATNISQWIELTTISDVIVKYYEVSPSMVTWTATVFMVEYLIFFIPISYFLEKQGIRKSVILGMLASMVGSWIKLASVDPNRFWVAFLGQCVTASTNALVLSLPARLAGVWFGASEVSTACSIAGVGLQIGGAVGLFVPHLLVSNGKKEQTEYELYILHTSFAVACTLIFILVVLFFKDAPPLPPSYANAKQKSEDSNGYVQSLKKLLRNRSFIFLLLAYGINVGIYNSLSILLNPIILRFHSHAQQDVGIIGLLTSISGSVGSLAFGKILDIHKKFKSTSLIVYAFSVFALLAFTLTINKALYIIYIVTMFVGFFISGFFMIGYELAAELTYPESEGTSGALLNAAVQVFGIFYNVVYFKLFSDVSRSWANIFFCINITAGMLLLLFTESNFKRQAVQNEQEPIRNCNIVMK